MHALQTELVDVAIAVPYMKQNLQDHNIGRFPVSYIYTLVAEALGGARLKGKGPCTNFENARA